MIFTYLIDWMRYLPGWGICLLILSSILVIAFLYALLPEDGFLLQGAPDYFLLALFSAITYLCNISLNKNGVFYAPENPIFFVCIDVALMLRGIYLCTRSMFSIKTIPIAVFICFLASGLISVVITAAVYIGLRIGLLAIAAVGILYVLRHLFIIDVAMAILKGATVPFHVLYIWIKELLGDD